MKGNITKACWNKWLLMFTSMKDDIAILGGTVLNYHKVEYKL